MFLTHPLSVSLIFFTLIFGGCNTIAPKPEASLKHALNKSFDANGYNYTSTTRITKLTLPKSDTNTTEPDALRKSIYMQKGIDVIRGFSLAIDGAVDYSQAIKSESTYDFHYNRDNVEISVKLPFLFEYSTKTLYMGKTFLNTIFPMKESDEGKLIRFDLNDTLLRTALGEESLAQFDEKKVRSINKAMKEGVLKAFSDLNGSQYSYIPVTPKEKFSGTLQKVHLSLDKNQSITFLLSITDAIVQKMYTEAMLAKESYGAYMLLSDPKQLGTLMENMNLRIDFDFGIDHEGYIGLIRSTIHASDTEESFALGIENTTLLNSFNAPQFTIDPKASGSVDYMDVFQNWTELFPSDAPTEPMDDDTIDLNENNGNRIS